MKGLLKFRWYQLYRLKRLRYDRECLTKQVKLYEEEYNDIVSTFAQMADCWFPGKAHPFNEARHIISTRPALNAFFIGGYTFDFKNTETYDRACLRLMKTIDLLATNAHLTYYYQQEHRKCHLKLSTLCSKLRTERYVKQIKAYQSKTTY